MYIYIHTHYDRCVCVRTYRRGLNVVCSGIKAMLEPQVAEQQQCSPAFFIQLLCVCMEAEHYLAGDRFFVCLPLSMNNFSLEIRGFSGPQGMGRSYLWI